MHSRILFTFLVSIAFVCFSCSSGDQDGDESSQPDSTAEQMTDAQSETDSSECSPVENPPVSSSVNANCSLICQDCVSGQNCNHVRSGEDGTGRKTVCKEAGSGGQGDEYGSGTGKCKKGFACRSQRSNDKAFFCQKFCRQSNSNPCGDESLKCKAFFYKLDGNANQHEELGTCVPKDP